MKIGFSGTREGMTERQLKSIKQYLLSIVSVYVDELHHGDCIGSDKQIHDICTEAGIKTVSHPPINSSKRAFCSTTETRDCFEYLKRDRNIVDETDILLATPNSDDRRGGTWYTIGYAFSQDKQAIIFYP